MQPTGFQATENHQDPSAAKYVPLLVIVVLTIVHCIVAVILFNQLHS